MRLPLALWGALQRINARRAVFEAFLMFGSILSGASGFLISQARARSLISVLPGWVQGAYYGILLVGGLAGLLGLTIKDAETGLRTERAGLIILAGHTAAFGCASIAFSGPAGIPGALMLLGFGCAALVRIFQIRADLSAYRAYLAAAAREVQE